MKKKVDTVPRVTLAGTVPNTARGRNVTVFLPLGHFKLAPIHVFFWLGELDLMIVAVRHASGEDWLSRTMWMVETIMVRHGFVDDNPEIQPPTPQATHDASRRWIKFLASLLGKQKLGTLRQ